VNVLCGVDNEYLFVDKTPDRDKQFGVDVERLETNF
jgi:hypothetical protein